jgi:hypothetical protein
VAEASAAVIPLLLLHLSGICRYFSDLASMGLRVAPHFGQERIAEEEKVIVFTTLMVHERIVS